MISKKDFNVDEIINQLKSKEVGAIVSFQGIVRNYSKVKFVTRMEIEIYKEMAILELEKIRKEALEKYGVKEIAVFHRYGDLIINDNIVLIVVAASHRSEAFDACRFVIEELKVRVPIWKKEYTQDGQSWVEGFQYEE